MYEINYICIDSLTGIMESRSSPDTDDLELLTSSDLSISSLEDSEYDDDDVG